MPNWKKLITSGSAASLSSVTTSGDITIPVTNKIYLDGGGDSYISTTTESSNNNISFVIGGNTRVKMLPHIMYINSTGANGLVINNDEGTATNSGRIFFEGNSTSVIFQEADDLSFRTGGTAGSSSGTERFRVNTSGASVVGDLNVSGNSFMNYGLVVNETANDADFRVEGTSEANLLKVDASTNNVGIATGSPKTKLHVVGTISGSQVETSGNVGIGQTSPESPLHFAQNVSSGFSNFSDYQILLHDTGVATTSYGIGIRSNHMIFNSDSSYEWRSDNSAKMTLDSSGNLDISGAMTLGTALAVAEGGTGATSLNNLITLGTHTTGNYVATITGGTGVSSTGATSGEGITHTLSIGQSVGTSDTVAFSRVNLGSTVGSTFLTGDPVMTANGYIMAKAIVNTSETGNQPAAITFGDGSTLGSDEISLITTGQNAIYIDSSQNVHIPNGDLRATNDVIAYYSSDKRLKDNIVRIENPLEKVGKIGGYTFDWNDKQQTYTGKDVGVIAQEIQEVLPEVVTERDNGYLAVKYEKIVPLLIESIKELKQEIDDIKQKCDCLNK